MRINDVLHRKGGDVVTVRPDDTVSRLLELLAEHRIGALVVSVDGTSIEGIVSERDVVRQLHRRGPEILTVAVAQIMTTTVETCDLDADTQDLARRMTDRRIRHIPVVHEGRLHGIVSIGDVVKQRLDELQTERDSLVGYLQS
jgi:CBS domain-containing protein